MNVLILLIGVSLFVAVCFLIGFIWSVKTGQYEDKYTPSVRILLDDEFDNNINNTKNNNEVNNHEKV
ncbi:MAG: hypothetical protein HGGPFJEG_02087 [Ignavibacteria bacterium]|nr:hypothetical protein [Ignavibacteria bacterium]